MKPNDEINRNATSVLSETEKLVMVREFQLLCCYVYTLKRIDS